MPLQFVVAPLSASMPKVRRSSSNFDRLPNELWRLIFDSTLLGDRRNRLFWLTKICLCSTDWMVFVELVPEYWQYIVVNSSSDPTSTLRFIGLAQALPLQIRIVLKSAGAVLSLVYLAPFLLRAVWLTIESDRADTLLRLRQTFQGLSAPALTYFAASLHHVPANYAHFVLPPLIPRPWFDGTHASLVALHLNCIPIPFTSVDFPSLREVFLSGRHYRYGVYASRLRALISNSPLLKSVSIRRFHCEGVLPPSLPLVIRSSSVEELDITFCDDDSTMLLASSFDFPGLYKLTVDVGSSSDADSLFSLPSATLSTVTTLVLRHKRVRSDSFNLFSSARLVRFYNVTSLDIRACRSWDFSDLLSSARQYSAVTGVQVLPNLASLTVGCVPSQDLVSFAKIYGACEDSNGRHSVLRRIRSSACRDRPLRSVVVSSRQWLASHVLDFAVDFSMCRHGPA